MDPLLKGVLIDSGILAGVASGFVLLVLRLVCRPRKFRRKLRNAVLVGAFVFVVIVGWSWWNLRPVSPREAQCLIEKKVVMMTKGNEDYQRVFEEGTVVEEPASAAVPGEVYSKVYVLEETVMVEDESEPVVHRTIARIDLHPRTRQMSVAVAETFTTPEERKAYQQLSDLVDRNGDGIIPVKDRKFDQEATPDSSFPFPELKAPSTCLVVTDLTKLQQRHPRQFTHIKAWLGRLGEVYDIGAHSGDRVAMQRNIRDRVKRNTLRSVFIFGNGAVVPFIKRKNPCYGFTSGNMTDQDVIYNDDFYGDIEPDPDWMPDVDVGRIPDDPAIIANANSALYQANSSDQAIDPLKMVGVANYKRSTADDIVAQANPVREGKNLFKSLPYTTSTIPTPFYNGGLVYLILHGGSRHNRSFTGEPYQQNIPYPVAFNLNDVDDADLVLCSACYGGIINGRTASDSISLSFLEKGSRGFMGFSAMSYSPLKDEPQALVSGLWMSFMNELKKGRAPSTAFRLAKNALVREPTSPPNRKIAFMGMYYGLPNLFAKKKPHGAVQTSSLRHPILSPLLGYKTSAPTTLGQLLEKFKDGVVKKLPAILQSKQPVVTAKEILVAGLEPVAVALFGQPLDTGEWKVLKAGDVDAQWRIHNGKFQIRLDNVNRGQSEPLVMLSTKGLKQIAGQDWAITTRIADFRGTGIGEYTLSFYLVADSMDSIKCEGFFLARERVDGKPHWRVGFGNGDSNLNPVESQVVLPHDRSLFMTLVNREGNLTFEVNGKPLATGRSILGNTGAYLEVAESWKVVSSVAVDLDYVVMQGKPVQYVSTKAKPTEPSAVKKQTEPARTAFGDGRWRELSPAFAHGRGISTYTDNKYGGTAHILYWAAFDQPQTFSIQKYQPPKLDSKYNQGERATIKATPVRKRSWGHLMHKDGVPTAMQRLINGAYVYRIEIDAPDDGHYAGYTMTYSTPAQAAIGKSDVDSADQGRAYIMPDPTSSAAPSTAPLKTKVPLRTLSTATPRPEPTTTATPKAMKQSGAVPTQESGSTRYVVVKHPMSWTDAKAYAERMGGHLVTISNAEENNFVYDLAKHEGVDRAFWIGLTDADSEGRWRWVTSEPLTFTAWGDGEPNNENKREHYVNIGWVGAYRWNDADNTNLNRPLPFVVEIESGTSKPDKSSDRLRYLEQLSVSAKGQKVRTRTVTQKGALYKIIASGVFQYDQGERGTKADSQHQENDEPRFVRENYLAIDERLLNADKSDLSQHTYEYNITGTGKSFSLYIKDSGYEDNAGSLNVRLYGP